MASYLGLVLLLCNISYPCLPFVIVAVASVLKTHFPWLRDFAFPGIVMSLGMLHAPFSWFVIFYIPNMCEVLERSAFSIFVS